MRIEYVVPVVIGILMGLVGLVLLIDAWKPDEAPAGNERRRRARVERHRGGEALVGLGVIGMGAAFMGRDVWEYRTLSVLAGCALLLLGAILNRRYLREMISNRGALRRGAPNLPPPASTAEQSSAELPGQRTPAEPPAERLRSR